MSTQTDPSLNSIDAASLVTEVQKAKELKDLLDTYPIASSVAREKVPEVYGYPINYMTEKCRLRRSLVATIIAFALMTINAYSLGKTTTKRISESLAIPEAMTIITKSEVDDVNRLISAYETIMGDKGPEGIRIKETYGYNYDSPGHEAYADYSTGPLLNQVIAAASDPEYQEIRIRSAILAAYNIIDAGNIEPEFDKLFKAIQRDIANGEIADTLPSYIKIGSWKEYLEGLGYTDTNDYHMNERNNLQILLDLARRKNDISAFLSAGRNK